MSQNIFLGLIYNISLLLMLTVIFTLFQSKLQDSNILHKIVIGLCIGGAGMLVMKSAVPLENGTIFDTRSILISVAGMFFGMIPTMIGSVIMITYRIFIGGPGALAGSLVIIAAALTGVIWHRARFSEIMKNRKTFLMEFYWFGLLVHFIMLLCMLTLPNEKVSEVISTMLYPILLIYPMGTYLLCRILFNQYMRNKLIIQLLETERELTSSKDRYNQLSEQNRSFSWECDANGLFTYLDYICEIVTGYQPEDLIGKKSFTDFVPEDVAEVVREKARETFANKLSFKGTEVPVLRKDGRTLWMKINGIPMLNQDGTLQGYRGINTDITEQKSAESERAKDVGLILSLLDAIPEVVFYKDLNGIFIGCNQPFAELVGKPKNEVIGKTAHELFDKEKADFCRFNDLEILKSRQSSHYEERLVFPDGREILVDMLKTPYWDSKGNMVGLLGISRDITERKRREDEILHISYHDQLTGLYNRRFYEEELIRLDLKHNLPLSIVIADINGLKLVNDSFGHAVGDKLLKVVAGTIQKGLRSEDIMARYGGDEFVIIFPKTDTLEAKQIISRFKDLLNQEDVNGIHISVSFGVETKLNEHENLQDIIKKSEDHMNRNKLYEDSSMRSKTIDLIMNTLYEKNHREMMHSKRVSRICEKIAAAMNMENHMINQIRIAGLVHDIGKIGIDERILNSPQRLNEEEWLEMQKHSEIGYRILSSVNEFSEIANYVLEHQEKWDGSGYPRGLKEEEISLQARIITIADSFDAMTTYRTYGTKKTDEEAILEIDQCAGTHFDPEIAAVFINLMKVNGEKALL